MGRAHRGVSGHSLRGARQRSSPSLTGVLAAVTGRELCRLRGRRAVQVSALALATAAAFVSATLPFEPRANAQSGTAAVGSRRVVEVEVAGAGGESAELDDTIRELLGRLTLVTESRIVSSLDVESSSFRSTARPSLLARVGIDMRSRDVVQVAVVDGRTGNITMRRSLKREGSPAVIREEIAHVVQAALDPLILAERDRIESASPPPPPPPAPIPVAEAPAPAPAPPTEAPPARDVVATPASSSASSIGLDLSAFAGAGTWASGAGVVPRAGGGVALASRRGLRPAVALSGHYVFPFDTGDPIASAHVTAGSIRALGGIEIYGTTSFALDVAAGGGVDIVGVEPRTNALPEDRLGASTTRVHPIGSAAVTGHLPLGTEVALSLLVGLDVDLASRQWVVETGGGRSDVFAPSRLRPVALLGFTFGAAGEPRFAPRGAGQ